MRIHLYLLLSCSIFNFNCDTDTMLPEDFETQDVIEVIDNTPVPNKNYKILALGDSYTIGQSVCETCRFPEQLKSSIISNSTAIKNIELRVIARTGWTTNDLLSAIVSENLETNYNLVTLLIGVNNQYQKKPFSIYEDEFPKLVTIAINKANNDKSKLIVLSIPDYAFTPFGNADNRITKEIDNYNAFAEGYCKTNQITFINITDITRMGLQNPDLVASDGLHPSQLAYSKFVERLLPLALEKLN